jgi:hypothetical protein
MSKSRCRRDRDRKKRRRVRNAKWLDRNPIVVYVDRGDSFHLDAPSATLLDWPGVRMSRVDLAMCKPTYAGLSRERFFAWAIKNDHELIADVEQAAQLWRERHCDLVLEWRAEHERKGIEWGPRVPDEPGDGA